MTAAEVVKALGGRGALARCPAHDDHHPSLSVTDARDGRLLTHCHAGCSPEAVWAAMKDMGLVGGENRAPAHGLSRRHDTSTRQPDPDVENKTACAKRIWEASDPAAGTLVETYLRARGITIPVPPSIRFHAGLRHQPTALNFPAMVAGVARPDGKFTAIHRTYLLPDGCGKAQVSQPKMALGLLGNGAVRLARAGKALGIAEGVETALSAMQLFDIPVWAALGSRLERVAVPEEVVEVQLFADNGQAGRDAAEKAAEQFTKEGRRVALRFPPATCGDWNDVIVALNQEVAG